MFIPMANVKFPTPEQMLPPGGIVSAY